MCLRYLLFTVQTHYLFVVFERNFFPIHRIRYAAIVYEYPGWSGIYKCVGLGQVSEGLNDCCLPNSISADKTSEFVLRQIEFEVKTLNLLHVTNFNSESHLTVQIDEENYLPR